MFLYTASIVLNDIAVPQLLLEIVCKRNFNSTVCVNIDLPIFMNAQDLVQKESAMWTTVSLSLRSALCVIALPFFGSLVDEIRSRKSMFIQPSLSGLCCILYLVLTNLKSPFHPGLLLIAAPISALGGDMGGAFLVSITYIAEVTPEKSRTLRLTFLDAFYCFAGALFAFVSGYILIRFGYNGMFATSLIINILNLMYIRFLVPDPRSDQNGVVLKSEEENLPKDEKKVASSDTQNNNKRNSGYQTDSAARQPTVSFIALLSKSNPFTNFKKLAAVLRQEKGAAAVIALLSSSFMSILSWRVNFPSLFFS